MIVLSIDPAWSKEMAYAVFQGNRLVYYDKFATVKELRVAKPSIVVTEDPFLAGDAKAYSSLGRVDVFKKLCFAVGEVSAIASWMDAKLELVRPVDWKTHFSLTKRTPANVQEVIRAQLTGGVRDEDIQDAILIGRYFIDNILLEVGG